MFRVQKITNESVRPLFNFLGRIFILNHYKFIYKSIEIYGKYFFAMLNAFLS